MAKEKNVSLNNYKHLTYDKYKKILGDDIKDFFDIQYALVTLWEDKPQLYILLKTEKH